MRSGTGVRIATCGSLLALGALPLACSASSPTTENVATAISAYTSYVPNIVWNDEFQTSALDRTKWVVADQKYNASQNSGDCFNGELQAYVDNEGCGSGLNTICQANDVLNIVVRYAPNVPNQCGMTQNYASARLTTKTKADFNPHMGTHGIRVEANINMPLLSTGAWPAFWMLGTDTNQWPNPGSVIWPQSGEMDIGEMGSQWSMNQNLATIHSGANPSQWGSYYSAVITTNAWHLYAVEWTPTSIAYFLDGNQVGPTNPLPTADFLNNFDIILNFAVGSYGGGSGMDANATTQNTNSSGSGYDMRQRMAVDYVRVYAMNDTGQLIPHVFQGTGYDAATPTEWDMGFYKGDCGMNAAVAGLSTNPSGGTAHAIDCLSSSQFGGGVTAVLSDVTTADHMRASRSVYVQGQTDWDSGYYKTECGLNEYVSGVSENASTSRLHAVRCASASMTNSGQNGCETHLVTQDDGNTSDWDSGHYKGQCGGGKVVVGVSASPSTGAPHKILCCSQ